MKKCTKCSELKQDDEFHIDNKSPDELQCYCKVCKRAYGKQRNKNTNMLYEVWAGMMARCNNSNHRRYHRYGGRGIAVCDEWENFGSFYEWAKDKKGDGLQIDRRDNDGDYTPENCRFATATVNSRNSSATKLSIDEVLLIYAIGTMMKTFPMPSSRMTLGLVARTLVIL